jgi:hypothetical protein
MAHTDETWFTYFHAGKGKSRGSKDTATIQTTTGEVIMSVEPSLGFRVGPQTEEVRESFEDNARLAGAAREMFAALRPLVQLAIDAGVSADAPAIKNALDAIEKAQPTKWDVLHDGAARYRGTHNECWEFIMNSQGQSVDYAIKHGNWAIERAELTPDVDAAPGAGPRV